ncbi:hypothetical protein ALC53_02566, partial [Atta colombica]
DEIRDFQTRLSLRREWDAGFDVDVLLSSRRYDGKRHRCACARANEYVKDYYYSSQYKLGAQYPLADVSIIHVHVLKYGGVGIASQLGEEEKDERDERDGAGRAEASTASFITNLFHPVVEMGHCSLYATKTTTSQSPSHDWCFHFSGVHHHRDKKCKPSTPTCKTQSLVESAFQEIGSGWRSRIKNSGAWGTADGIVHALEENPWIDNSFEWLLTIMGPPSRTK